MNEQEFFTWNEEMAAKYNPDTYHESSNAIVKWIEASRVRKILEFLNAGEHDRVLEVGVGAGNILAQVRTSNRFGMDLSPTLLEIARKRLPDAQLYEGNAEAFYPELRDQRFDRVYCSEVLEHVQHPESVVREMAAVLAPGGTAVISVPNEKVINAIKSALLKMRIFKYFFPKLSTKMDDEWHLHTFDQALLQKTVEPHFEIEEIVAVPYAWLPIRLVSRLRKRSGMYEYSEK